MKSLFESRHIGISADDEKIMLQTVGAQSLEELVNQTVPASIRLKTPLELPDPLTEQEFSEHINALAAQNVVFDSYIGRGWYGTATPAVILRNVFENPSYYTSYTPYQAEISQGRLEALLNFQTAISDLTAMPLANASMLDDATAAAEAATMMHNLRSREQVKNQANTLFVDENVFPNILAVIKTRTGAQGIDLEVGNYFSAKLTGKHFGAIVQFPNADGNIEDYADFVQNAHNQNIKVAVCADLMSLALLTPPGEWDADIVFGSTQRWGIPMGYGGPSAAYFATREDFKRDMPGRIIGISKDANGKPAYRMALQTREQHIKREKATSNICTAQALTANMAGFYAVYHGKEGIKNIAQNIHGIATYINEMIQVYGFSQENDNFFDSLKISLPENVKIADFRALAEDYGVNFYYFENGQIGLSVGEDINEEKVNVLAQIFAESIGNSATYIDEKEYENLKSFDEKFERKSDFLQNDIFKKYHTETEMMRYIKKLERRDISLTHSMISLGSCTMKLNAAVEMLPLSNPQFANIHPLAPADQTEGYNAMIESMEEFLAIITGFSACSLQPNSGAAGEFAGLMVIKEYLKSINQSHRHIVLIPASAHGTNPASAVQAGFTPVVVKTDINGNTDLLDWETKAIENANSLAACMITYPSTHGIFEVDIIRMCEIIHQNGGQVYMDGANMNAQVGLTNPATIGADVCHLNLHKTFAMPHGGGGPGVGPICCAEHLAKFLPSSIPALSAREGASPLVEDCGGYAVASAPYGSAMLLPITYAYILMLGEAGLKRSTEIAILNANYLAAKLKDSYGIVYTGTNHRVGHELILECRNLKNAGITETDIAKRLMDYGFHAPTLSFPVHGTLMVEPTESESLAELDKFVDAMLQIFNEIKDIENGSADNTDNLLLNAPHPEYAIVAGEGTHPYTREQAAYPTAWVAENKFWCNVARVDNAWGDRNLICCRIKTAEELV
ncbi:MAG: aminomethyl-transferring glycine dehydrogenase [Prevotellaceae bacterium]|jgi:glycine dehydrogenase|nr:aminomethyl-transferring glycine dehydrogenase [Prevotellaceae bacterium]